MQPTKINKVVEVQSEEERGRNGVIPKYETMLYVGAEELGRESTGLGSRAKGLPHEP